MWTTDGTANGTLELAGIIGAAAGGVAPTDLTVFNHEALFTGTDTAGHLGLWVTNGTAGGTQELTGIASASSTGLDPTDMMVFYKRVPFVDSRILGREARRLVRRLAPLSFPGGQTFASPRRMVDLQGIAETDAAA